MKKILIGLFVPLIFLGIFVVFQKSKTLKPTDSNTTSPTPSQSYVPLPRQEDIIQSFFNLINEKRIPQAISVMDEEKMSESEKQDWGVHFNNILSAEILSIEKTNTENMYKVTVNIKMSKNSANAVIPYYGWGSNPNIRFITLTKNNLTWKINEIATGP